MPGNYTIRYLPDAQADLLSIYDWIAHDNPRRACAFVGNLDKRVGALETMPHLGRIPRYPKLKELGYRVLILDSYLIFYIVGARTIEVRRVIHASRHLDDLF